MTIEQLVAAGALLSAVAFALTVTVAIAARRMATLGELVPYQPGPRARSGLLEFAVAFGALVLGQLAGYVAADRFAGSMPDQAVSAVASDLPGEAVKSDVGGKRLTAPKLTGAAAGALVSVLAIYCLWRFVLERGPRALSQANEASTFVADVGLGFWAFLMSATPVYGLQGLLMQFYPKQHALIDRLESGIDPAIFAAAAFSAVIAAPLTEEIVFRGFLLSAFAHVRLGLAESWARALFGAPAAPPPDKPAETIDEPVHESPVAFRKRGGTLVEGFRKTLDGIGSFPVVASSAVFALLHFTQGPAPIPLFLFSLMLGYLYRQTGRIVPSVVAHFALNATTILLTGLSALNGAERPQPVSAIDAISVQAASSGDPMTEAETVSPREGLR